MMASQHRSSKNFKPSIKYWWIPLEVQSFDPNLIVLNENLCAASTTHTKDDLLSERKSSKGLTISHFRSAAAGIWDCVGQPAIYQSKRTFKYDNIYKKDNILFQFDSERDAAGFCGDTKILHKNTEFRSGCPSTPKPNFDDLRRIKKMMLFASCNRNVNSLLQSTAFSCGETNQVDKDVRIEASNSMEETIACRTPKPFFDLKVIAKSTRRECRASYENCNTGKEIHPHESFEARITEIIGEAENTNLLIKTTDSSNFEQKPNNSLSSALTLEVSTCAKEAMPILRQQPSVLQNKCSMENISSAFESNEYEKSRSSTNVFSESPIEDSLANYRYTCQNDNVFGTLSLLEGFPPKPWLAVQNKLHHAFSYNRHAIAGALAGTLVTLCLHPVDTVKTIIQANGTGQKSFYHIVRRIISQHGILGLYRGIASNITSSAPISAIYTFTYESVKCTLLDLLPKEYDSFAHCIAGGCSSIATSFIFTPSECIKQQMQVSSQYQNCWNALVECLQKGGIPSLYAGWGAVLCRNIPHSIIKFYTYESLQQFFSSAYPDSNLKTLQTLVCGGLAGSTAALFTTPFDVVKTRLQTQAPGSIGKYRGVFHTLLEIARQEGFQGLYRGLTPRLAMYVSQGAIFFASYELLKAVFLLEPSENIAEMKENAACSHDDHETSGLQ